MQEEISELRYVSSIARKFWSQGVGVAHQQDGVVDHNASRHDDAVEQYEADAEVDDPLSIRDCVPEMLVRRQCAGVQLPIHLAFGDVRGSGIQSPNEMVIQETDFLEESRFLSPPSASGTLLESPPPNLLCVEKDTHLLSHPDRQSPTPDTQCHHAISAGYCWSAEAWAFTVRYHQDIAFDPERGVGAGFGYVIRPAWIRAVGGSSYTAARQRLMLTGGAQEAAVHWYQAFLVAEAIWSPKVVSPLLTFLQVRASVVRLVPQPFALSGVAGARLEFHPRAETKFWPGLAAGLRLRLSPRLAAFLLVGANTMRVTQHRIEFDMRKQAWRIYSHLGGGLSVAF